MCFRKEKHVCWASLLFFFWIASSFTAFFFFDRLRSKTPSFSFSSSRNPSSPLSRLQRPLLLSFLPPFFLLLCVRLRRWKIVTVVCLKCLRSTYSVKKKKKKRMDELFGNIWYTCAACAYFVTVLKVECWEWLSITREQKREKMQKKKEEAVKNTFFFLGFRCRRIVTKIKATATAKKRRQLGMPDNSMRVFQLCAPFVLFPTQFRRYTFFFPIWLMSHCYVLMICSTKRVYS